jgi:hypothetical protein
MAGYLPDPTPPGTAPAPLSPIPKPPTASGPVIPPQVGRMPIAAPKKKFSATKKPGLAGKLRGLGK